GGRARKLTGAKLTREGFEVGACVCVHAKGMKEAWHLAASDGAKSATAIIGLYAKRWTIEPSFRDTKDLRFGMDKDLRTSTTKRRTHSLFRQGCMWFGLIPNMPEPRLRPLLIRFGEMINQNRLLASALTAAEK